MDQSNPTSGDARACYNPKGEATSGNLRIDIAVVVPTYKERENVAELLSRLETILCEFSWEVIFVDDDSPDGTPELIRALARGDRRVRLLNRIGRRGLSSACIEGMLATSADLIVVIDADMQHDESILPQMIAKLQRESLDVVIGTRNSDGGSMGQFEQSRKRLSNWGRRLSYAVCGCQLSDPMSGFFVIRRAFLMELVHRLRGNGFKILVDIFVSSTREVNFGEVGYSFRDRLRGESKLDIRTSMEYVLLLLSHFTGDLIPLRFAAFAVVGSIGMLIHVTCLALLLKVLHVQFMPAQTVSIVVAMVSNFFLNNLTTYRDRALRGARLIQGLGTFCLACSFGAWSSLIVAHSLLLSGAPWYLAGLAGVILSSVWNYSMTSLFTWQMPRQPKAVSGEGGFSGLLSRNGVGNASHKQP